MGSSDGRFRAAAGSLDSLSNPKLASMTAAELVVHLYNYRRGSDFADVALVLAARERGAADAEARIRAADEVAGRLRDEIRRAAETEARLRAEIRALERRADEAEARARLGSSDISGRAAADGTAASEDDGRAGTDLEVEDREVEAELGLGAQGPAAASEEAQGGGLAAESGAESNSPRDNGAWGNLRAPLAIVSHQDDLALAPLEVIPPGYNTTPNHGMEDDSELQNNVQDLYRAVASPVLVASKGSMEVDGKWGDSNRGDSDTKSSPVALQSKARGGIKIEPSNSTVPSRVTGKPREKGIFYKMVLKALHERDRRTLAIVSPHQDDRSGYNTTPNYGLKAQERLLMDVGGMGDDSELKNNVQDLYRAVASPVLASKGSMEVHGKWDSNSNNGYSDTKSSPVALHSEGGGGIKVEPSNSTVPPRATTDNKPHEKGIFYKMVLKALHERERRTLAKAAASQSQKLKLIRSPLPSESVALEEDHPHGEAPQK